MTIRRGTLRLGVPLLLAAAAPLYAQFQTYGCPGGPQGNLLNGFTAGTSNDSQICLEGNFIPTVTYNVTLTSPLTSVTISSIQPQSNVLLELTVSIGFYATVSTPGQPDPVTISIGAPQVGPTASQTGTFQINPPLQSGGPVFVSAVNSPVSWTLFTDGTAPYQDEFSVGSVPNGMAIFPSSGQTWGGTPSQTGVFQFTVVPTDGWGNEISDTLSAYIVPKPQLTSLSQTSATVGSGNISLTINGSGFVGPITVGATPEPGSSVLWTQGGNTVALTPSKYSANQLTVTLPSSLFTATGVWALVVVNPGPSGSNGLPFDVTPSITGLSSYIRTAGTSAFPLGVTGTGFVSGSVVKMNGTSLPTTFLNATSLTAIFPTDSTVGPVTVTVLNPDGTLSPQAFLTIAPQPTLSGLSPASVTAGGSSFQLTATGAHYQSGMAIVFNSIPLSTSLVANQQNNQLTAVVPASLIASGGTALVWVATLDGYTTAPLYFTVVTSVPPLQLLTFSPLPAGVVNTAYSDTFAATGGVSPYTFAVIAGALPAGLQLSAAGTLSGTPTAVGPAQFTVQLTDSNGAQVARDFSVNIAPQPLTLTTPPLANTLQNSPISIQFAGSGGVPPYTFVEFGALPPGTQISSGGLLSGTPTQAGTYPFLLFLDDSTGASTSKKYSLSVAPPGLLITPPSPLPSGQINVPYTTQLAATGGAGAPYTWYAAGLPSGLTMANNSGLIAGIPRAAGTFTLSVTVTDYFGATVTQNYTLVIASATVTLTTGSLANGAVGSSYSAAVSASGGSGTYTFTATGLPPGLTMASNGTLSGTPTAAGAYTVAVTAADAQGLSASASYNVTIAPKLGVTAATVSNAVLDTAISAVTLTASGGTPPYQWQSAFLPPGLNLASNGTLSGTPTAAGTFSFLVYVVDSNGALASGTVQVTVGLPAAPPVTITGLPATNAPATQPRLQISLANPYPVTLTANLRLTFVPVSGADDPSIQFDTGGRTAQIAIPAGFTGGLTDVGVQTGTVAGTITVTVQLLAGTQDVTPSPAPSTSVTVSATAPVITSVTATRGSTGFTVLVTGYASNRDVDSGTYQFSASAGSSLLTSQVATSIASLFTQWYGSSSSAPYGSQFTLTQPFTVNGSPSAVLSVTVTLTNALGTSPAALANLQ